MTQTDDREKELAGIRAKLKELLISSLNIEGVTPDQIKDDDALFGEGLCQPDCAAARR